MAKSFVVAATESFVETLRELGLEKETEPDPKTVGRKAAILVASEVVWKKHLGPLLDTADAQELLGVKSRQAVADLRARNRLLGLPKSNGRVVYPVFQFDDHGRPFETLVKILGKFAEAGVSPWTVASWFVTPQALLKGKTPAIWLKRGGDSKPAIEAAERTVASLAS